MLPSAHMVDLTVDDGYATADDLTVLPARDASPTNIPTIDTPSEISEQSYDGTTLPLPPKGASTSELLQALLASSAATNQLLVQLVREQRPDRGRPQLVQPTRVKEPSPPRDPDFFDDGRSRTSKRPVDLSLPNVDAKLEPEPSFPTYAYNPPPTLPAAGSGAPSPAASTTPPDPSHHQRIRGYWIGAGSPRPSDFSEDSDQSARTHGSQPDNTGTDAHRPPATPPDPAPQTAPSRKSSVRSTSRAHRRSQQHTPTAPAEKKTPGSAPAGQTTPSADAPPFTPSASPSAASKSDASATADSLPTPPAHDSLIDVYADIHAARRADMHAAKAMYPHVSTLGPAIVTVGSSTNRPNLSMQYSCFCN